MAFLKTLKKKLLSVLFWSIISAAFIGPGTVTTATQAGVYFNFALIWAFVFSVFACILLQEAAARVTIYSKYNLGEAIAKQFEGKSSRKFVLFLIVVAIILGCAAYETGNILGAVEGLVMVYAVPKKIFVIAIGILSIISLSLRSVKAIANFMGIVVFFMGIAFIATAIALKPDAVEVLKGCIPTIPRAPGAGILVLGLIGTTVVPYDLFMGSGAADKNQKISDMRFGIIVAIVVGGLISMAIMGAGNAVSEGMSDTARANMKYSFSMITEVLEIYVGKNAVYLFGFGMFAAGFSSAITSPLASAMTAQSLFSNVRNNKKWEPRAIYFKLVAFGVLAVGLFFGIMEVKPIPAIIMAQAFNGLILPLVSIFLLFVVNDTKLMGKGRENSWFSNVLLSFVVWITMILGFNSIANSVAGVMGYNMNDLESIHVSFLNLFNLIIIGTAVVSLLISLWLLFKISKIRIKNKSLN